MAQAPPSFAVPVVITVDVEPVSFDSAKNVLIIGRLSSLNSRLQAAQNELAAPLSRINEQFKPQTSDQGSAESTFTNDGASKVTLFALPETVSRHNSKYRPDQVTAIVNKMEWGKEGGSIVCLVDNADEAFAAACACARGLPAYSRKKGQIADVDSYGDNRVSINVSVSHDGQNLDVSSLAQVVVAAVESIRRCAWLVDAPTNEVHTGTMVQQARDAIERIGRPEATIEVIEGSELVDRGFGGLVGVGKAAVNGPALAILSWKPSGASRTIALVGKGIVYDTGGLSIKPSASMPGMKRDMGGAACVLTTFEAAVQTNFSDNLYALLCLAENSVGPASTRPDDILTMYSGKTVEVNNTDAEGRLVLGDGVAYATKHLNPDVLCDVATLTGAQGVATGQYFAAAMSNSDELELSAIHAGRSSGDLVHPIPYCPEFFRSEFASKVADMKNSVKNRTNAQASCAGQFIGNHMSPDFKGEWLHLDIAYPVEINERATGYGVALLLRLFHSW